MKVTLLLFIPHQMPFYSFSSLGNRVEPKMSVITARVPRFLLTADNLLLLCRRSLGYKHEVAHELESQQKLVQAEQSHYNETDAREMLAQYEGGHVHLETDANSGIATVTIENAKNKNAFTGAMMIALADHVTTLSNWSDGRLVRVRGSGTEFCSGGDLRFMGKIASPVLGAKMSIFMQTVLMRLIQLPMVTVAQIQGHAMGGGAELAVACDLRVMHRDAKIGFVQAKLGISPGWGGGTHLRRHVRRSTALRILASSQILTANEAKALGLADDVVENVEDLESWCDSLTASVPESIAVRAAKRVLLNTDQAGRYMDKLDRERHIFTELWGGAAHCRQLEKVLKQHVKD